MICYPDPLVYSNQGFQKSSKKGWKKKPIMTRAKNNDKKNKIKSEEEKHIGSFL